MFGFRSLLPGLALLAFSAGATIAQDAASPGAEVPAATLRLNARSVLVDVVVMDKEGHAVPGLTRDDFQITENGKPQAIDYFEQHLAASGAAPTAPPLPPNTFTNVPATVPNEAVNVLLMDALNTSVTDQVYVRRQMVRYLASLPPGIRIGVFVLGEKLEIVQGFTDDSALLRASIDQLASKASTAPLESKPDELATENSAMSQMISMDTGPGSGAASALQAFLRTQIVSQKNYQFLITMKSLQTIARYVSGIPGRKNLIWFVGDLPLCLPPACPYDDVYRETVDILAKARVSVYPVDARGVLAPNSGMGTAGDQSSSLVPGASVPLPGGTGAASSSMEPYFAFIGSETWAEKTGGKAFHGNDFKGELAEAIDDGSRYYTLAYTPRDRKEIGRERKIEVTLTSRKYKVSYRRSYFEETPKQIRAAEAAPVNDPLRPLMDRGMPNFTELRYRMTVAPFTPQPAPDAARAGDNAELKPPFTRYRVNFSLATDGVKLVQGPDGVRRGSIEVALIAYSQAGKPLNWEYRIFNLAIHPEQNAIAQNSGIPFYFDIDAPPGDVYLRTGIYAVSSSRAGTLEIPLSSITVARK